MSEYCKNCYELAEQLHHKKQECEILKEINAEIQESEIELENMKNSLFIDYMKYKQAIEEIKEIAESNICSNCDTTSKCKQLNKQNCDWKQIIQKCEEVNANI